jgi:hypothetical protein
MQRQLNLIAHETRRQQLASALTEIERRLADLEKTA